MIKKIIKLFFSFIFSSRLSLEERKAQPLAGSVLRVKNLGTHGFPAVAFDG